MRGKRTPLACILHGGVSEPETTLSDEAQH